MITKIMEKGHPMDSSKCKFCDSKSYIQYNHEIDGFYECSAMCKDSLEYFEKIKKQIKEKEAEEKRKKIIEKKDYYLKEAGLGTKYINKTFENFKTNIKSKKNILEICLKFIAEVTEYRKTKGLFMIGKPGTGKTHLCAAIINRIFDLKPYWFERYLARHEDPFNVKYINVSKMLNNIKYSYTDNSNITEEALIRKYSYTGILFLDDLGKEYIKSKEQSNSWANEKIYEIINNRYEEELPTIITSNLNSKELEKNIDPAIISRFYEMCIGLKFDFEDYRRNL